MELLLLRLGLFCGARREDAADGGGWRREGEDIMFGLWVDPLFDTGLLLILPVFMVFRLGGRRCCCCCDVDCSFDAGSCGGGIKIEGSLGGHCCCGCGCFIGVGCSSCSCGLDCFSTLESTSSLSNDSSGTCSSGADVADALGVVWPSSSLFLFSLFISFSSAFPSCITALL